MIAEKHMWRRSDTFYWRRRMTLSSTGTDTIQVSLRTTDRREAAILARRLTVESDKMFAQISETGLTPQQATIWLRSVVDYELPHVRRLRIRAAVNPDTSAKAFDTRVMQLATAMSLIAKNGFGSCLDSAEKERLSNKFESEQITRIEEFMRRLASGLLSSDTRRKIVVEFRRIFGNDTPVNESIVSEMTLLLAHATAEVWGKAIDDTETLHFTKDLPHIVESAMTQTYSDVPHIAPALPSASYPAPASPRIEQLEPVDNTSLTAPSDNPHQQQPLEAVSVDAVIETLIQRKTDDKVRPETIQQYRSFGKLFTMLSGVTDVRRMTQADLSRFEKNLRKLPKTFGKSAKDKGITLNELLKRSADLPEERIGLAPGTHNRHITHLNMLLQTAESEGYLKKNDFNTDSFHKKEKERAKDKRETFQQADLEKLLQGSVWTGSATKSRRHKSGKNVFKDGLYWIPIIAAHSGARRAEIAGLRVDEIQQHQGIWCFNIKENENRGLKNAASNRLVPIHPRLLELGLLDHVETQRKQGILDLFPEQRPKHEGQRWGDPIDYNFSKALKLNLDGNVKSYCFHSIRHYVVQKLKLDKSVTRKVRHDLAGHEEGTSVSDSVYGEASHVHDLYEAVCNLPAVF
jgi:integrase/DNA-binding transcriptional regulator YhcF (GntR family)